MLLISPTTAAQALEVSCGVGREAATAADALITPLNLMLPRVEAALDTITLEKANFIDTFRLSGRGVDGRHRMRLSNAFVSPDGFSVTDRETQLPVDPVNIDADYRYGVVSVPSHFCGTFQVAYTSGFSPKATKDANGVDIPLEKQEFDLGVEATWLQTIAIAALNEWFRSIPRTVKVPDNVAFRDINHQANRYLQNAIWGKFMRDRFDVTWPSLTTRGA